MPRLRITILTGPSKGRQHRFDRFPVVIGRSADSSLAVIDDRASRAHLRIRQMPEGLVIEDLQSKNGTYVDEVRVSGPLLLTASKVVRLGQTQLQLEIEGMEIERAGLSGEMKGPRQLVEAIVVLDLCDSTIMANRYGDTFALQLKEAIRTLVRPVLADKGVAFLKGTGDGFLATFPDLHKAAEAAVVFEVVQFVRNGRHHLLLRTVCHFAQVARPVLLHLRIRVDECEAPSARTIPPDAPGSRRFRGTASCGA